MRCLYRCDLMDVYRWESNLLPQLHRSLLLKTESLLEVYPITGPNVLKTWLSFK